MTEPNSQPDTLATALSYAARGWRVIPLHTPTEGGCSCRSASCASPGKHPRTRNGVKDASTDTKQILTWWQTWPDANVGIAAGAGLLVLDVDGDEGQASLQGRELPLTPVARTGGGTHYYYAHPGALRNAVRVAPGLDIRSEGGYVVAPPSLHASGALYEWYPGLEPDAVGVADAPGWLVELVGQQAPVREGGAPPTPTRIGEGGRNAALTQIAGSMRRRGASDAEIAAALSVANRERCDPPLADDEVGKIVRSVARYTPAEDLVERTADEEARWEQLLEQAPAMVQERPKREQQSWPHTDLGNAERMVARHGDGIRYCWPQNSWYIWDGQRWRRDEKGAIQGLAVETVRSMMAELKLLEVGSDEAKALYKHAMKSEGERRLAAMVTLAKGVGHVPVMPDDLDADDWVLNVQNGTLDLQTGTLRPHRREDLLTRMAPVAFDPDARSDLWDSFLATVTAGNQALVAFLQRVAGYALTGSNGEEKLFLLHGPTRTGKSSFLDALTYMMGEYSSTATIEAFMERPGPGGNHNEQIACLAGARLVVAVEAGKGRRWDEETVKRIVGGDKIRVRNPYERSWEFRPRFKLWFACNDRPRLRHDAEAMWERMVEIPFVIPIPPQDRDPRVKQSLRADPDVMAAVLAWAVQGTRAWLGDGLQVPEIVEAATGEYREEMDPLGDYMGARIEWADDGWVSWTDLWESYTSWLADNGLRHRMTQREFRSRLQGLGAEPKVHPSGSPRGWGGLRLRSDDSCLF